MMNEWLIGRTSKDKEGTIEEMKETGKRTGRKIEGGKKNGTEAFRAVNTIFNKPIHKIVFEIQGKQFFKCPKPMGGDPSSRYAKLRCSYHKDHG